MYSPPREITSKSTHSSLFRPSGSVPIDLPSATTVARDPISGIWVSVSSCTPIVLCTHYRSIDPPSPPRHRPPVTITRRLRRRRRRRRRRRHADASLSVSHRSSYLRVYGTWRIMVGLSGLFGSSESLFPVGRSMLVSGGAGSNDFHDKTL